MWHEYKVTIDKTLLGIYPDAKIASFDFVFSSKREKSIFLLDLKEIGKSSLFHCISRRMQSEQNSDHKGHKMLNL